jgi:hypothetical protein
MFWLEEMHGLKTRATSHAIAFRGNGVSNAAYRSPLDERAASARANNPAESL